MDGNNNIDNDKDNTPHLIRTLKEFDRDKKIRDQQFDFDWQVMVRAELDKLRKKHKTEEEQLVQKLEALYKENKDGNDEQDKYDRANLKDTHEMLSTLYLLKWLKAERSKTEPIPDRPGYFETTIWHKPIDWPPEFGRRPELPTMSSILKELEQKANRNSNRKSKSAV
jgi:hypothetical protein